MFILFTAETNYLVLSPSLIYEREIGMC